MLSKNEIKYIQSLGHKKRRDEERLFLMEGNKMVAELLAHYPSQIVRLYATETFFEQHPAAKKIQKHHIISEEELGRISQLQTPNQALALVHYFQKQQLKSLQQNGRWRWMASVIPATWALLFAWPIGLASAPLFVLPIVQISIIPKWCRQQ